ncbi:MAG: biotin/lipoyl-binding protein, partial [Chthoniobacterales bacterium]
MNPKRKRIIIILAVALVAFLSYVLVKSIVEKRRGLVLYGNVDIREVDLGFRVSGKIMEVLKDEGDSVKTGDLIAKLDPEPYRRRVDEAKGQVAALKAHADMLKKGYRQEEIDQAQSTVTERESTFSNAQNIYSRQKGLLATRAISQQDYDDATQRFNEAKARLQSARQNLTQLTAGYRPEEVAQANGDLQKAEAQLASAELDLKDTELLAPNEGTIITRELEAGAIVAAGTPVLTLSLDKPVWVRAYVHE